MVHIVTSLDEWICSPNDLLNQRGSLDDESDLLWSWHCDLHRMRGAILVQHTGLTISMGLLCDLLQWANSSIFSTILTCPNIHWVAFERAKSLIIAWLKKMNLTVDELSCLRWVRPFHLVASWIWESLRKDLPLLLNMGPDSHWTAVHELCLTCRLGFR